MIQNGTSVMRKTAAGLAVALLAVGPGSSTPAFAKRAIVSVKQQMASTGADADAKGRLRFVLKTAADGRLVIQAGRLSPDATFEVLADGVKVGTLTTRGGGGGRLRLRSAPRGGDELLGFDPRGTSIVLRDGDGDDVLAAMVADDSIEPGKVACCIPDDSGTECEDRTADECVAQGGTVTDASTCLPNPCDGAPAPDDDDIVCCIPDDSGPECEDRTIAECAAQGGTVVDATSCAPNPCSGTAPADDEIACCVPHGTPGEPDECETETPATCAALGGTPATATSCNPDPCGGGSGGGEDADDQDDDDGQDDSSGHGGDDD